MPIIRFTLFLKIFKDTNYNIDEEVTKFVGFITTEKFSDLKKLAKGDKDYIAGYRKVEDLSTDPEFIGYYDYEEAKQHDIEMAEYTGIKKVTNQEKATLVCYFYYVTIRIIVIICLTFKKIIKNGKNF